MTAPYTPKPSILDRVLSRLIPTDQYGSLLDPTQQRAIQRQSLIGLGTGILAQSGPGSGPLQAFGKAYQGLDIPGMADQALKLQAYRSQLGQQQAIAQAASAHQPAPGASRLDRYNAFVDLAAQIATIPGGAAIAEKMAPLIQAMKPDKPTAAKWSFQTIMENGEPVLYRINEDTGTKYRVGLGKPSGVQGGVMAQETKAAARNALAALNQADALLARDPEADVLPVAASVARGAERVPIIGGMLSGAMDPIAQHSMRPTQQQFQQAMDQFLHNYSALLPRGGRSVQILKNLRNSFAPAAGQTDAEVRKGFATARAHLRQTLEALAAGREPTGPLPGTELAPTVGEYDELLK